MEGQNKKILPEIKYLIVLDFEATCEDNVKLQPCSEIIQFPAIIVNTQNLNIECQFHQYVKPRFNPKLTNFCTQLTGITQQMVQNSKHIEYVLEDFSKWIQSLKFITQNNYTFVTCGDWDLATCLKKQAQSKGIKIPNFLTKYINIKKYFAKVRKLDQNPRGMMQMLEMLKIKHQGKHHSGIDDVKNICKVCIQLIRSDNANFPTKEIIQVKIKKQYKQKQPKQVKQPEIKYLIVLDFEATCENNVKLQPCSEIIQFPAMIVNTQTLNIECQFHQYVKPRFNPKLTNFCTQLTGITQQMVQNRKQIEYVLDDFYKWIDSLKFLIQNNFTFVTCGDWDLNTCLKKQAQTKGLKVPNYLKKYINIKKYFVKIKNWNQNSRGMMEMLTILKIQHEGKHHSGIDDVNNICKICIELIKSHSANFPLKEIVESKY